MLIINNKSIGMDKTKLEASHVFMYNVNRIWTILKNQQKVNQLLKQEMLKASATKTKSNHDSSTSNNQGQSNLSQNQSEIVNISLTIHEMITNSFFKQITFFMKDNLLKTALQLKFVLYPNTLDNSTLTILEISLAKEEDSNTSILPNDNYAIEFLELFDNYLKVSPECLNEYQSILINSSCKYVLECLLNQRQMRVIANCFKPNYPNKKLKMTKCEKEQGRNQWFIIFELFSKESESILTQIKFNLLMINDNCTFLTFNHDFWSSIEQQQLNSLAQNKKEFLFELKKRCEEPKSKNEEF